MSTQPETIEFILEKLQGAKHFSARAMFGEYALYADGKTVALVCDDLLYVKILPQSASLEKLCEKGEPYPRARPHYIATEDIIGEMDELPDILRAIARALPAKKKPAKKV